MAAAFGVSYNALNSRDIVGFRLEQSVICWGKSNEASQTAIYEIADTKAKVEVELQKSQILLTL